eukprot:CAMPEP_0113827636 /NCGR_PEP_ID=MMETSP0328-20130328/4867_1 /TAXON_ID=39455 /ORGANISM="Alexandrium minutum" /LENGTH=132 /DNA_ID=CAMNT_0000795627 /DNA_START=107 /DNA_END=501 /DNA_ORIENTATION=- /assembly_acc=CAM_ASM_000350
MPPGFSHTFQMRRPISLPLSQRVLSTVRDVQESVIPLVLLVDLGEQRPRLRRGAAHEEVDGLVGGDGGAARLVDVLVDDVLELADEHAAGHQELLLLDVREVGARGPLADHGDAVWVLRQDALRLRAPLLEG